MYSGKAVIGLSNTKMLYGVHVSINANKMADKVLAAFLSAFFSTGFFFFLSGFGFKGIIDLEPVTICLEMVFGFSGIRMSVMLDMRRGREGAAIANSERRVVSEAGAVFEKFSGIILMVGPSPPAPSQSDAGSLIKIVYTYKPKISNRKAHQLELGIDKSGI